MLFWKEEKGKICPNVLEPVEKVIALKSIHSPWRQQLRPSGYKTGFYITVKEFWPALCMNGLFEVTTQHFSWV